MTEDRFWELIGKVFQMTNEEVQKVGYDKIQNEIIINYLKKNGKDSVKQFHEILCEKIRELYLSKIGELFLMTSKQEMMNSGFADPPKFGALIAEFNGQTAGYLSYTWNYSIWNGCDFMNLDDLFVWSEYRGKKVGLQLMQHARDICKEKGKKIF